MLCPIRFQDIRVRTSLFLISLQYAINSKAPYFTIIYVWLVLIYYYYYYYSLHFTLLPTEMYIEKNEIKKVSRKTYNQAIFSELSRRYVNMYSGISCEYAVVNTSSSNYECCKTTQKIYFENFRVTSN